MGSRKQREGIVVENSRKIKRSGIICGERTNVSDTKKTLMLAHNF